VLGDVLLAGNAIGAFPDLAASAKKHVEVTKRYLPDAGRHERYRPYVELYRSLFDRTRDLFVGLKKLAAG